MKQLFLIKTLVLFAGITFSANGDKLDDALEELKKKVHRHTYSAQADLDDQKLAVPVERTEEEKALDTKLKNKEKKQDTEPASDRKSVV